MHLIAPRPQIDDAKKTGMYQRKTADGPVFGYSEPALYSGVVPEVLFAGLCASLCQHFFFVGAVPRALDSAAC